MLTLFFAWIHLYHITQVSDLEFDAEFIA